MTYRTIDSTIGNTPLVELVRLPDETVRARKNVILGKLEGSNPAGSVKDRAALSMIRGAESRGQIKPGDVLIEASVIAVAHQRQHRNCACHGGRSQGLQNGAGDAGGRVD